MASDPALWEECDGSSTSLAYLWQEVARDMERGIPNGQYDNVAHELFRREPMIMAYGLTPDQMEKEVEMYDKALSYVLYTWGRPERRHSDDVIIGAVLALGQIAPKNNHYWAETMCRHQYDLAYARIIKDESWLKWPLED